MFEIDIHIYKLYEVLKATETRLEVEMRVHAEDKILYKE